jgi:signal transduction histidine kinase
VTPDNDPLGLEFIVEFAHDLQEPLGAVLALSYGLHAGLYGALTDAQAERIAQMQSSARAMSRLIDDLVKLADTTASAGKEPVTAFDAADVLSCVGALGKPMAESTGLRLVARNFAPNRYFGPGGAITRVLLNLVTNAVKFTDSGAIVFGARQIAPETVEFFVRDTGNGGSARALTPPRGTPIVRRDGAAPTAVARSASGEGLTLIICRRLLRSMGSALEIDSRLGEGNAFRFSLHLPEVT